MPISPFQSTHPVWGATLSVQNVKGLGTFQSTHPVWGATPHIAPQKFFTKLISIHAPRVGCDGGRCPCFCRAWDFNPRTPCGVRLPHIIGRHGLGDISIHAPRVGCDKDQLHLSGQVEISIHAPRVGCDSGLDVCVHAFIDFNPRTPCGVRPAFPTSTPRL